MRSPVAVTIVCAVIVILAGDILYWYRLEHQPLPAATAIPRLKWTRTDDSYPVMTAPMVASDGTLYVANMSEIHAYDSSGAAKWVYRLDSRDPVRGAAVAQDATGDLYFTTWKSLYSLSPSGLKRWQADCPNAAMGRDREGSSFRGDALYASCDNHLVALNESDGREVWELPKVDTQASDLVPVSPLMLQKADFVFSLGQRIFAADSEGNTLWSYPADSFKSAYLLGVGLGDTIYVSKSAGELTALESRGQEKWTFNGGRSIAFSASPVAAVDGTLYVVAERGPLFALNSDGTEKWAFNLPPTTNVQGYTSPMLSPDGVIYQLVDKGVIAISPLGKMIWQMPLRAEAHQRGFLAIARDGTLYAAMDNSAVFAIQTRN